MQQVKIFKKDEDETHLLEEEVNQWIRNSGAKIISITGNIAPQTEPLARKKKGRGKSAMEFPPSDVLLIVLYEASDSK